MTLLHSLASTGTQPLCAEWSSSLSQLLSSDKGSEGIKSSLVFSPWGQRRFSLLLIEIRTGNDDAG